MIVLRSLKIPHKFIARSSPPVKDITVIICSFVPINEKIINIVIAYIL